MLPDQFPKLWEGMHLEFGRTQASKHTHADVSSLVLVRYQGELFLFLLCCWTVHSPRVCLSIWTSSAQHAAAQGSCKTSVLTSSIQQFQVLVYMFIIWSNGLLSTYDFKTSTCMMGWQFKTGTLHHAAPGPLSPLPVNLHAPQAPQDGTCD